MKNRQLLTLIVVAGILILGALFIRRSETSAMPQLGQPLYPDLRLNDITRVEIASPTDTTVLARKDGVWVCETRFDHPVRFEVLRNTLLLLEKLETSQPVSLTDEQRRLLRLAPPASNETADATRVSWSYGNTPGGTLYIGGEHHRNMPDMPQYGGYPDGRYIASAANGPVYLVKEMLEEFHAEPELWLVNEVVNVAPDAVTNVTITYTNAGEKPLTLFRAEGASSLSVPNLKSKEEEVSDKLTAVAGALNNLTLNDVGDSSLSDEVTGFAKPTVFTLLANNGVQYTVKIGSKREDDSLYYVRLLASLSPASSQTNAPPPEVTSPDTIVKEVNDRCAKWTYLIPGHKAEPMMYKRADLVKKKDDDKKSDED